ncbi:hypothetical protein PR202_gb15337 [Eleusine coracana subsp. coracana]|uniref:HMA domain-containing protein n=1 Tax=Eleusine coracana subsp. coracana TaxID=191504 RepID=A0AAV5EXZ8_ELECO|nr:hypothetical protein QOZ80_4BG0345320 [Eleusine coracana subsp. coracana]GJN27323.1 hypothetical protein PR202_gb15337 [Eleusine coracana subsp. coracana]
MKKKIVIKVLMKCECDKCRKKALGIAASAHGVISVGITGDAKDRLEVVGDGVDSVCLVRCLRRKFCHAEIVQVEEVKENKPEKKPEKKTEETKQKIVIKVHMTCDKCRKKALGIAATAHGVQSMGIEGEDREQLVVVGDGVDAINLTSCLRKKVGSTEIVTVEAVADAEDATEPENEAGAVAAWPQQWCPGGYYYSRPGAVYPYNGYCYDDGSHFRQDSWCTIM